MTSEEVNKLEDRIRMRLAALSEDEETSRGARETVLLDQQSVGRLSRMDALQQQAMAKATQVRREAERAALEAALRRMTEGEFGYCEDCGENIPIARLTLNPALRRCIDCVRG